MGFLKPPSPTPATPPAMPPPFVTNQKPQKKQPMQPTFLGGQFTPGGGSSGGAGATGEFPGTERGKTLLGQ